MNPGNDWQKTVPRIIYEAYPEHDLLPIESPKPSETLGEFELRAREAGDTLFLFLCRKAQDEIDTDEYVSRLDRAIRDIEAVQAAFFEELDTYPNNTKGDNVS